MAEDSRRHERADVRLELNYRDATGGNFLFEYSRNISRGGIFIETQHPAALGTRLVVRFQSPEDDVQIEVAGEVVWVNAVDGDSPNPGMGIQWTGLDDETRAAIAAIVKAIAILPD
jgi:type IV pilus assembly protein PilZ